MAIRSFRKASATDRNKIRQFNDGPEHKPRSYPLGPQDAGDGVGRFSELQKRLEAERFFQRVDVLALQILDHLGLDCFRISQFDHADRN